MTRTVFAKVLARSAFAAGALALAASLAPAASASPGDGYWPNAGPHCDLTVGGRSCACDAQAVPFVGSCGYGGYGYGNRCSRGASSRWRTRSYWAARSWRGTRVPCEAAGVPCSVVPRASRACGVGYYLSSPPYASYVYGRRDYSQAWWARRPIGEVVEEPTPPAPPAPPLSPAERARDAFRRGDFAESETAWRALADADPKDASAWVGLAHAAAAAHHLGVAADALRRASSLGALSSDARFDLATLTDDPKGFRAGVAGLRLRVRSNPLDTDARLVLAWLDAGIGETEESRVLAHAVLKARTDDPVALALLRPPPSPAEPVAAPSPVATR
jgi:hypothetical protein